MKVLFNVFLATCALGAISCSKSHDGNITTSVDSKGNTAKGSYLLGLADETSESGKAVFLPIPLDQIDNGVIDATQKGLEGDGGELICYNNQSAFSYVYTEKAKFDIFKLKENGEVYKAKADQQLSQKKEFYGIVGNNLLVTAGGNADDLNSYSSPVQNMVLFSFIDGITGIINSTKSFNSTGFLHNGEAAQINGIADLGNNEFITGIEPYYIPTKEEIAKTSQNNLWNLVVTHYPNEGAVAVFDYKGNVISKKTDSRIGKTSAQNHSERFSTIGRTEGDYVYVFSTGEEQPQYDDNYNVISSKRISKNPAGVVRFNYKKNEFDPSYYYNMEKQSGGYRPFTVLPLYGNYFLINFFSNKDQAFNGAPNFKYAVFDVSTGAVNWITGLPDAQDIQVFKIEPYADKDSHKLYIPISAKDKTFIYDVDVQNAKATKGVEIKTNLHAISLVKLNAQL